MKKSYILGTSSVWAICSVMAAVTPGRAQDSGGDIEQVVVSASRISIAGYQQPTPVTVVGAEELGRDAQADLSSLFKQMPAFGNASSPDTTNGAEGVSGGAAGVSTINLRNLGVQRTLTLIDGNRVVGASTSSTGVDLNMIPTMLLQRVDVVTGGASAAWGSDAVAGVVNFIMNNNYEGLKGNLEYGINDWENKQTRKAELAYGASFLGDRLHVVMGFSYLNQPDNPLTSQADWFNPSGTPAMVNNPAYTATNGQPQYITRVTGLATQTNGGLIVSNPAGTGKLYANVLRGIQFVGPNATPAQFNFGTISGQLCYGCSAPAASYEGQNDPLGVPVDDLAFYSHTSYRVLNNVTASAEVNLGQSQTKNSSVTYQPTSVAINAGNPYIPATVAAIIAQDGITSFQLGTTNFNNLNPGDNPATPERDEVGGYTSVNTREFYRGVFSLDGTIGNDWGWHGSVGTSTSHSTEHLNNTVIVANYNNAVNAVLVTPQNVGNSGLSIGSIACADTLLNPNDGCSPLDVFGTGVASQAAINYINPPPNTPNDELQHLNVEEDTATVSAQGTPFSLPAGQVAVAFGFEYRKESALQTADALSYARAFAAGNSQYFNGEYNTKEGFAEVNAPVLKNQGVQSLELDAAGRVTDYSTSGLVETWKLGMVSQLNEDFRVRASWSFDIRAPDLTELFAPITTASVNNAVLPTGAPVTPGTGGNPNLKPELSTTLSGGVILTPHWVPGLSISADWYSINIKAAVYTPTTAQVYNECVAGLTVYCQNLIRNAAGTIVQVNSAPINAASETTSGLDFQADYAQDLAAGQLALSLRGGYLDEQTTTSIVGVQDTAGSLQNDTGGNGIPKFRATVAATYGQGPWSGTVQTRLIGASHFNNTYHDGGGPNGIDNNDIPFVAYLDLRASYYVTDSHSAQLYVAIDNIMDRAPPVIPYGLTEAHPDFYVPTDSSIYDILGRVYRVGIRVQTN